MNYLVMRRPAKMFQPMLGILSLLLLAGSALSAPDTSAPPAVSAQSSVGSVNPPLTTPQKSHQQGFLVPFTPVPGQGAPLITVRLNDRLDATFVVDTGTGNCLISQALAAKLGAVPYPALLADGKPLLLNGKQPQAITLISLQIGGKSGPLIIKPFTGPVLVVPQEQLRVSADRTVDGMIGSNLLDSFAVIFDFPKHVLALCLPGNLTVGEVRYLGFNGVGGTALPISRNADETYSVSVKMENGKASNDFDLLVDTGSQTTEVPIQVAKSLSLVPLGLRPAAGGQGNYMVEVTKTQALTLGDLRIVEPPVAYGESADHKPRVGLDILSGYKVLLDFPARKMYLQPPVNIIPLVQVRPSIPKAP